MEEVSENASLKMDDANGIDFHCFVEQELETLQCIYINEIAVQHKEKCTTVSLDIHPATADNHDEQYVRMTLKFILNTEYPETIPEISIHNPRGLSEEKINSISQDLTSIAESKIGNSMLFEIIEAAKEHLTNENYPCGECAICLYGFSDGDVFTKTECYHYFHSHCLARYIKNASFSESNEESNVGDPSEKETLCPMCRLPIHFEGSEDHFPPPISKDEDFVFDENILELQKMMADLYQKQLDNGGIIDIEAEKNKYLLEISNVPTRVNVTGDNADSVLEAQSVSETDGISVEPKSPSKDETPENKVFKTESRNKFQNRTKNDKYDNDRQPRRGHYHSNSYREPYRNNSYRGNQRNNRFRPGFNQNNNRKNKEAFSTEDLEEDYHFENENENESLQNRGKHNAKHFSEDSYNNSSARQQSSNSTPYKKNDRSGYPDRPRRFDGERRGNYYNRSYPNNRGQRHGPNTYDYHRNRRETKNSIKESSTNKNEEQEDNAATVSDSITHENSGESLNEKNATTSPNNKECDESKDSECDNKVEGNKKQDSSNKNSNGYQNKRNSYRYNDSNVNSKGENATGYEERRDSNRGYRGGSNRGYRNQYNDRPYRENNYHGNRFTQENNYQGNRFSHENNYQGNRFSHDNNHQGNRFSHDNHQGNRFPHDNHQGNRFPHDNHQGNRFPHDNNQRRNYFQRSNYRYSHEGNYNERRVNRNRSDDPSVNKETSEPKVPIHEEHELYQNDSSKKTFNKDSADELGDGNYAEKSNRYNDRNRFNSYYQNRYNPRGNPNNRYNNDRSHYQNGRNRQNSARKFNGNKYSDIPKQENDGENKPEVQDKKEYDKNASEKPALDSSVERVGDTTNKHDSNEISFKESKAPVDPKMSALGPVINSDDIKPIRSLAPPSGFSNPQNQFVYGLQAANPPPGFTRC